MKQSEKDTRKIAKVSDKFFAEMLQAMFDAYDIGMRGWDDPSCEWWNGDFEAEILRRVAEKIQAGAKGNEVDIANYMMMLKYLREHTSRPQAGKEKGQ